MKIRTGEIVDKNKDKNVVSSVKLSKGTRVGTLKLTVNGEEQDSVPIRGLGGGSSTVIGGSVDTQALWDAINKKVDVDFFKNLFTAYDSSDIEIATNTYARKPDNLKISVGTWTEEYLSALGKNSEGGGGGGGVGTVTGIALGTDTTPIYPDDDTGIVTLPAYPIKVSQLVNDRGFVTSSTLNNYVTSSYLANNFYTKAQADSKYMTIAAFESLFNALDSNGDKINHPYSSGVDSIKALVGLWTEQYLSALGQNGEGGGGGTGTVTAIEVAPNVYRDPDDDGIIHMIGDVVTSTERTKWNAAAANSHTHSNKAALDTIDASKIANWNNVATIMTPDGTPTISRWPEVVSFLSGYTTSDSLSSLLANKVDVRFFNNIFTVYDGNGNAIVPNTYTQVADNLKILVGTWTEEYLSALGKNSEGGSGGTGDVSHIKISSNPDVYLDPVEGIIDMSSYAATWNNKQNTITDLATIRSNASHGNTAYSWGNHANAGYALASNTVSNVAYNTTSKKLTKTVNGTTTDIVTAAAIVTDGGGAKASTTITAGNGLTGGGDLSSNRTINVVSANAAITVNADNIKLNVINDYTTTTNNTIIPLAAARGKDLNDRLAILESWFEEDADGNIKTKDMPNGTHRGFYTESFVSALGLNSEGGGGGTGDVSHIKIGTNPDVFLDPDEDGIIDMSSYAANWNDAYNKRHTHSNKSVLDGITSTKVSHWDAVYGVVPQAAYESGNSLADKNFVNSSISTSTATFRGTNTTATTESAFLTWANGLTHDLNDYVFWSTKDSAGNTIYKRYKYDGSQWVFEYDLNNSSLTSDQWSAINSGITSTHVSKLNGIASGAQVNVIESIKVNGNALSISSKAVDITAVPLSIITGADDLKAIEGLSGTGFLKRTGNNTWALDTTVVLSTRKVSTGNGLQGGGDLSADRTISILLPTNSGLSVASTGLKLDIVNNLTTASDYRAISATQAKKIWDLLNQMFTLEGAGTTASPYVIKANYGLYTNQFLSALGQNSQGGGGGDFSEEQMWAALQANSGTYENAKINWNHIPLATTSTAGAIKVGSTLQISNGILNQATIPNFTADVYTKVTVDTYGRVTQGGDLLADDIPTLSMSKISGLSTALGNVYTKAESDAKYITALGTNGNYLTYTKNGNSNSITVPYATKANSLKSLGRQTSANLTHVENGGVQYFLASGSMTTAKPANDGYILHFHWDGSAWDSQLFLSDDPRKPYLQYRANNPNSGGGWGDWVTVLDTSNTSLSNGVIKINGSTITPLTAASNLAWGKVTGTPTTLSGYGITDAYTKTETDNKYITALGVNGNNLTWTKNGTTSNITVPYATKALYDANGINLGAYYYHSTDSIPSNNTTTDGNVLHRFSIDNRRRNDFFWTISALAGRKNYFYCAHLNPDYQITSSGFSNVNNLFNSNLSSNATIPADVSTSNPAVITIEYVGSGSYICATDTTFLMFVGHTGGNVGYLKDYKVEINVVTASSKSPFYNSPGWHTVLQRSGVEDELNGLILPIHLQTSFSYIKGIRITINSVQKNVTWTESFPISKIMLIDTRPSFTAAQGLNALDVSGGDIYGAVKMYSTLTMGSNIYMPNDKDIAFKDTGGTYREAISLGTSNTLYLGYGTTSAQYNTVLSGYRIFFQYGTSHTAGMILNSSGNLAIGVDSPSYRLHVGGTLGVTGAATLLSSLSVASGITLTTTKKIYFGDSSHYLELDANGYFHFSHGLYSDSFVSALGVNSQGGGGSTFDEEQMWQALGSDPVSAKKIDNSHLNIASWALAANKPYYTWSEIQNKPSWIGSSKPSYAWSEITDKPSTFAPSAHDHSQIVSESNNRSVATTPDDYNVNAIRFRGIKTKATIGSPSDDTYSYLVGLRGWSDNSGGNAHELAFNNSGIYRRQGAATTWGDWYKLLDSGNTYVTSGKGYINGTEITTITGNAGTATKLQTARTIWGQSFDGSANVSGAFSGATTGTFSSDLYIGGHIYTGNNKYYFVKDSSGKNKVAMFMTTSDIFLLGYGTSEAGYSTTIDGNSIALRYGTSHTNGLILDSSGNTTLAGSLYFDNNKFIYFKDNPSSGTAINRNVFRLSSGNSLFIGEGSSQAGYNTYINGSSVFLRYGTSNITGLTLNTGGNVVLAENLILGNHKAIYAADTSGSNKRILMLANNNLLRLGIDTPPSEISTRIDGYKVYFGYGANYTTGLTLNNLGQVIIPSTGSLKIGDATLSWDSTNQMLKVDKGFYSEGAVSALGSNDEGGSSDFSEEQMWAALQANTGTYANAKIDVGHIPNLDASIITSGTFNASRIPLATSSARGGVKVGYTTNGKNYAVQLSNEQMYVNVPWENTTYESKAAASGGTAVSLVTTGEKYTWNNKQSAISDLSTIRSNATNGNTAYGWGNHANAGYALASDVYSSSASRTKNTVLAAPSSANGAATFRALVSADIPDLSSTYATAARATTLEGYFTSGSAKTAIALKNSRTLWGQSFDGTANVSGNMTGVGSISASDSIQIYKNKANQFWYRVANSVGSIEMLIGATGNMGLYDRTHTSWIVYTNGTNTLLPTGNVGINTVSPSYKLDVNGTLNASGAVTFGSTLGVTGNTTLSGTLGVTKAATLSSTLSVADAVTLSGNTAAKKRIYFGDTSHYLELDSTGFHFVGAGVYSDSFMSALGANSSGGGSSTFDEDMMWTALQSTSGTYATTKIATSHIPDMASTYGYLKSSALSGYATQTWVNQQGFLTTHQSIYALTLKAGGTAVTTFTPNSAAASLDFVAGSNISLTRGTNQITIANTYSYTLPLAASGTRGGVQIGYSETNSGTSTTRNYAVKLSSEKMYVNVPWTDTTYKLTLNGTTNGASGGTSLGSFYAPTASGTANQVLISGGANTAPSWTAQSNLSVGDSAKLNGQAASYYATASNVTTLQGYFTDGVAKVAAKLNTGTTTYTAWGQTYWSSGVPQSISGNMTSVGSITPSANGNALGTTSARFNIYGTSGNFSGNVSITGTLGVTGATTLTGLLTANGGIVVPSTKTIKIGDCTISWDSTNSMLKFDTGIYSTGAVSALGSNSSGGGSGTFDEEAMWTALGTTSTAKVIASSHIPNLSASKITSGTFAAARIPVATASAIGGIKVGTTLAISDGVLNQKSGIATAGTYRSVTIDTYGRVTAGSNPTTLAGYGITDAKIASGTITLGSNTITPLTSSSSLAWGKLTGTPTTLSGYGITNAYTKTQVDNALGGYLPLSGGTVTLTSIDGLTINKSNNSAGMIRFTNGSTLLGYLGFYGTETPACNVGGNYRALLHAGNYSSYALPLSGGTMTGHITFGTVNKGIYLKDSDGNTFAGIVQNSDNFWIGAQQTSATHHTGGTYISAGDNRNLYVSKLVNNKRTNYTILDTDNTYTSSGKGYINGTEITTISGNAATATTASKLSTTSKTAWGQTYWTSGGVPTSISGNISSVGNIYMDNAKTIFIQDTDGTDRSVLNFSSNNNINLGYGTYNLGTGTYIYGKTLVVRIGGTAASANAVQVDESKNMTVTGYVAVGTGGASGSYVGSSTADSIYLNNSSGAVLVCKGKVVRRTTTLSDVTLGESAYPWLAVYANTFYGSLSGNATTATTLQTSRNIWGKSFNGSAAVKGDLYLLSDADGTTVNTNSAKLKFNSIADGTNIYRSPYIQGVGGSSYGRKRLGFFQSNATNYTDDFVEAMSILANGRVGIGTTAPSAALGVTGSIVASSEVTASSDERKKNIISDTKFNVKDIASARSVLFEWNDGRDDDMEKKIHGGSIAQDWLGKADSFLMQDEDGFYSINYGALALCSAITIAREVVRHDDEITRLKKEVVKLRERVAELEERRVA